MIKTLSSLIGFLYIVMGIFVLYYKTLWQPLTDYTAYALGSLLIGYGLFRIFRQFLVKNSRNEDL